MHIVINNRNNIHFNSYTNINVGICVNVNMYYYCLYNNMNLNIRINTIIKLILIFILLIIFMFILKSQDLYFILHSQSSLYLLWKDITRVQYILYLKGYTLVSFPVLLQNCILKCDNILSPSLYFEMHHTYHNNTVLSIIS